MQHLRIHSLLLFGMVVCGGVKTAMADVQYSFTPIDVPGSLPGTTTANGINDSGQIVGSYTDGAGMPHSFLATPTGVPEPSTLPLVAACLIGLAIALRRKSAAVRR